MSPTKRENEKDLGQNDVDHTQGKVLWLHGWCTRLWIKQSKFKLWSGALCFVLGEGTLLFQPGV